MFDWSHSHLSLVHNAVVDSSCSVECKKNRPYPMAHAGILKCAKRKIRLLRTKILETLEVRFERDSIERDSIERDSASTSILRRLGW